MANQHSNGCTFCGSDAHIAADCPWKGKTLTFDLRGFIDALESVRCFHDMSAELIAEQVFTDAQPQASAAQSAPTGERDGFEAWYRQSWGYSENAKFAKDERGQYTSAHIHESWVVWQAGAAWQRTQSAGVPDGMHVVPFKPTEDQWGGLARDIVWWMRSYPSNKHTPATLMKHLGNLGREIPDWMGDEAELRVTDHVMSKGTIAVLIYKAMLAAAPVQPAAQAEFGDAYQGAREDLAIWKRRALEAEEKLLKAEQSTPAAIEVIGYASPGQVEIVRSLTRTGGMKVKGCKDGRYTEPVVLLSAARAALFAAVIRCEQVGAFKTCMECGYQDGHDEICKFHYSNRAAQDQGEVQRLREALIWLRGAINCTAENDVDQCGAWISTRHPMIQRIDELLAASTGQEV